MATSGTDNYFYNEQIKKYLLQFMAVFTGLHVKVGRNDNREAGLIPVPIHYGSKDRVSASLKADNTQNKPIRLPILSAYMNGIDLAPERRKGTGFVDRRTYLPRGGALPDDIKTVERYMPIPYNLSVELMIFASNQQEQMQILEQILMLFDPILQIQSTDAAFDWAKLTTVELMGVRPEENYPSGTDHRLIQTGLDFQIPIWIAPPGNVKASYVNDIKLRIITENIESSLPEDIIAEIDGLGIDYYSIKK